MTLTCNISICYNLYVRVCLKTSINPWNEGVSQHGGNEDALAYKSEAIMRCYEDKLLYESEGDRLRK